MSSKSLPLSFARCLLRLQNGERLLQGDIKNKILLKHFCEDGIIKKLPSGNRRSFYYCPDTSILHNYLRVQYDILSLYGYMSQFGAISSDGESSLSVSKSTKTFRRKSLQGFFIKAFNSEIVVSGETIKTLPSGIDLFIHQPEKLRITKTALIIGVENPECFIKFDKLLHLFQQKQLIVIMRYLSSSPNRWLRSVSNKYLHFGDFDPAGLSIYFREYLYRLPSKNCNFFIPPNIDQLLEQYGQDSLYDNQVHLLMSIDFKNYPELEYLVNLLHKHRKGLEQERLLIFP